jgi:hypothetical protein
MTTLTHGDGQDLLAAFKQGWERRTPDGIVELFTADAEYRADPFSQPMHGANAIREWWNEIVATQANVEFDAERIWVSGPTILASWHAGYTRRADGQRLRARGFMTMEVGEGAPFRIQRLRIWPIERVVGTDSTFEKDGGTNGR